jgi:DNA-binding XRE family transcriptional regulator
MDNLQPQTESDTTGTASPDTSTLAATLPDIKKLCKEQGKTLTFMAGKLGISLNGMSKIAKRRSTPRIDNAMKLAELLGMPVEEIWPNHQTRPS